MRAEKLFLEQELEREKRMVDGSESKFRTIAERFKQIFGSKSELYAQRGKVLSSMLAASRYGLVYPTLSDEPQQVVYADQELSGDDAIRYLDTILFKSRRN